MKNRLKQIRESRGLTLGELASRSGYAKSTINNFENEKTDASDEFLTKIANVLKTDISEILDQSPPIMHEGPADYRTGAQAEVMRVLRGGPALAAKKMDDGELMERIKEHAEELQLAPHYMRGPQAEIISALALELYERSKKKSEEG